MKNLAGKPVLWHDVERCLEARTVDRVILATTTNPEDDTIESAAKSWGVPCYRGSSDNVLDRYYQTALAYPSDIIVRITSDCPLIDPVIIDRVVSALEANDYVTNIFERNFPRGLDVEVFTMSALKKTWMAAKTAFDREHVTTYIRQHAAAEFRTANVTMPSEYNYPNFRLTLDTQEDYQLFEAIYNEFYKEGELIHVPEVLTWLTQHPEVSSLNVEIKQKHDPTQSETA